MRVYARREYWSDLIKVYVIEDWPTRALVYKGDSAYEWVPFPQGGEPPVFFAADTATMQQVAAALTEFSPKVPATEDALQDAREVRDRLLTLVEKGYEA